uniref:E3 ubiquitin-protein ligase RNF181 n=1 Tax=Cyprinus carpio carpio TaxID=630221 RepID=A0A8C1BJX1_CYPCA
MSITVSPRTQKNSTDRTPCWSLRGNVYTQLNSTETRRRWIVHSFFNQCFTVSFSSVCRSLMQGLDIDSGSFDLSDWDQRLPPPAAKAVVQSLPIVIISSEQADKALKCPVCLLEFEEQETVREMPCKHLFHTGCILPWLSKTNSCPLCRLELPTDNPDYEEFKKDKERRRQREHRLEDLHGSMYT